MNTTATKPTLNLNASTLTSAWEQYLLDRIFCEAFWSACDDFCAETFDDLTEAERETIHTFLQEKTQVIIKSKPLEWDNN